MRYGMKKHMFGHHHKHSLNMCEKMCIVTIIGFSFLKGVFVGMYLGEK